MISMDMTLLLQRGFGAPLAFGVCTDLSRQFIITSDRQYKFSFLSTRGSIISNHFSKWIILWLKNTLGNVAGVFTSLPEEVVIFPYYQVHSACIKVNLVILKRLKAHIEVYSYYYQGRIARGGSLGSEDSLPHPPPPSQRKVHQNIH